MHPLLYHNNIIIIMGNFHAWKSLSPLICSSIEAGCFQDLHEAQNVNYVYVATFLVAERLFLWVYSSLGVSVFGMINFKVSIQYSIKGNKTMNYIIEPPAFNF